MRLVFMGTPDYVIPVLTALLAEGHEVVGVVTQPDRAGGRGRRPEASPVKRAAQERGITVLQPASFRDPEAVAQVAAQEPELVVVASYGKILPPSLLAVPPLGTVNVHPSLLPRHRGPSPVSTAILEGDETTGVTIMLLDRGMDTGPVLAQESWGAIGPEETTETLTESLFQLGARLLVPTVQAWGRGELVSRPQDDALATVSRRLTKEEGELDFHAPADRLWRQVRAYRPWPGTYTRWGGRVIKVLAAIPVHQGPDGVAPGEVVELLAGGDAPWAIGAGDGLLGVRQAQMEGRRPVSAREFLQGYPGIIGARLPS